MFRTVTLSLFSLASVLAQGSPRMPQAPQVTPGMFQITEPVFDVGADGAVIAAGPHYVARFDTRGASFTPFLGSEAERTWPVTFALATAKVGDCVMPAAHGMPVRDGNVVSFARGCAVEVYELRAEGMEQRFVFGSLPGRGELRLHLDVATDLHAELAGDGIHFVGPRGGVRYGKAIAIDAAGRVVAMSTELVGGDLELVVPAAFMATAALPLVIDPLVTPLQTFNNGPITLGNLDFAWDNSLGEWLAVWDYALAANNYQVYAQRIGQGANPIGSVIIIDAGATSWKKPRVGNLAGPHRFLVVAECDDAASSPWIGGRIVTIVNNAPVLFAAVDIARSGQNGAPFGSFTSPDVGGQGAGSGNWAVVYEYGTAPGRDIHLRLVDSVGTALGGNATLVGATAYDERGPRISKSNGSVATASQTWGVLYERRTSTGAGDFSKVWGAFVTTGGTLRSLLGQTTYPFFDNSVEGRGGYDISSPTDDFGGTRYLMAVESRPTASEGQNLFGAVFTHQGLGGVAVDLMHVQSLPGVFTTRNQHSPAIDCDGTRFALAFTHDYSATDQDLYAATFALGANGAIVVHEAPMSVANTTNHENGAAICSRRGGGGIPGRYLLGYHTLVSADHQLRAVIYEGLAPGGIAWRGTSCGNLSMSALNAPGLGMPVNFHLTGVTGLGGFLAGLPWNVSATPCPVCTMGTSGVVTLLGTDWVLVIPNDAGLVGVTIAVQGFEFGNTGPCLGQLRASNTADLTIR